mgnify:CR=1 FL=1
MSATSDPVVVDLSAVGRASVTLARWYRRLVSTGEADIDELVASVVRDRRLAAEMVDAMGDRPVVLLRGHGLTSTGAGVAEAVLRAVSVDGIARLSLTVASAGGVLRDLPAQDMAELPDLGGGLNLATAWRHEVARLGPSE